MKSFLEHIKEEVLPSVQVADGGLNIDKPAVRAAINAAIAGVVSQPAVTPYVVFNRLSKLLAQYHIVLPKKFLEGDKGVEVFEIKQFGHRMGMTDSGEFVNEVPSTHYLFLQYGIITPMGVTYAKPVVGGMYRVTARLVDRAELDRLLDMAEITMSEEAECRQMSAKAMAPKDPMHDVTSDPKKVGNKKAVATSEKKSLDEAPETMGDVAKSREGHPNVFHDQDSVSYKASADRMKSGSPAFDPHRTEIKRVDEDKDPCWKGYEMVGMKKKGGKPVPNCVPVKESRMPASVIKHKQRIANMTPEEKAKKFAGKSDEQLKSMARRHGFGKDSNEYSKTVKEEKGDRLTPGFSNRKDFDTIAKEIGTGKGGMTIVDKAPKGGESSSQTIYPMSPKSGSRVAPDDVEKKLDQTTPGNPQAERNKDLQEKAPPGAKFERMVRHIKKGYSKDGLSAKEKSIAYATAWKAKNREKGE